MPDERDAEIEALHELLRELWVHDDHNYGEWSFNMRCRVARALGEPEPQRRRRRLHA